MSPDEQEKVQQEARAFLAAKLRLVSGHVYPDLHLLSDEELVAMAAAAGILTDGDGMALFKDELGKAEGGGAPREPQQQPQPPQELSYRQRLGLARIYLSSRTTKVEKTLDPQTKQVVEARITQAPEDSPWKQ